MENDLPQLKKRKVSSAFDSEMRVAPEQQLRIKRLSKNARLPTRGSALAAGYDLYRYIKNLYTGDYSSISVIVQKKRSFLRMGKQWSTLKFQSLYHQVPMVALHLGVDLVCHTKYDTMMHNNPCSICSFQIYD